MTGFLNSGIHLAARAGYVTYKMGALDDARHPTECLEVWPKVDSL